MHDVYSVSQINSYIKNMFAGDHLLRLVSVSGEISKVTYHYSGHIYFSLKDEGGVINCVMYKGSRIGLDFQLEAGQSVICRGEVTVFERDGKYQYKVTSIKKEGIGALAEQFEALKLRLEEQGMFAPEYKQELPKHVKKLGVVTAPTGAAVRDIINVSTRRNPYIDIILYPALVQGDGAPSSIVAGIEKLEQAGVDLIIVGRGGGSIEDLWCFNDERVAQAIFNCQVPIISAVGHETDFTIADFVADMRAPTPSAAAELAVFDIGSILDQIDNYKMQLNKNMYGILERKQHMADRQLMLLKANSPYMKIKENKARCQELSNKLNNLFENKLEARKHQLEIYIEKLKGLSPLEKLSQGYVVVSDSQGSTVVSTDQVKKDDKLYINMKNGVVETLVTDVKHIDNRFGE